MRVAIVGYGRMGHMVYDAIQEMRDASVTAVIDPWSPGKEVTALRVDEDSLKDADVVIDFSVAASVAGNALFYARMGIPSVIGTTGWYTELEGLEGELRSLGARKRDIYNVFNAESFIVGLFAGVIGVVVTYILQPIVNVVIQNIANMPTLSLCSFNPLHALLMVVISFCLTVIAGLVPSSVAAKRDPVVALRSE